MVKLVEEKDMQLKNRYKKELNELVPFIRKELENREMVVIREEDVRDLFGEKAKKLKSNSLYTKLYTYFSKTDICMTAGTHKTDKGRIYGFFYKENDGKK